MDILRGFITGFMLAFLMSFTYYYYSKDNEVVTYTYEEMLEVMQDVAERNEGPDEFRVGDYNVDWLHFKYDGSKHIQEHYEWTIEEYLELVLE